MNILGLISQLIGIKTLRLTIVAPVCLELHSGLPCRGSRLAIGLFSTSFRHCFSRLASVPDWVVFVIVDVGVVVVVGGIGVGVVTVV